MLLTALNRSSFRSTSSSQPEGTVKERYREQALREGLKFLVLGERRAVPTPSVTIAREAGGNSPLPRCPVPGGQHGARDRALPTKRQINSSKAGNFLEVLTKPGAQKNL